MESAARFLLLLSVLVSCNISKTPIAVNKENSDNDSIIFLVFTISKVSLENKAKIELVSKIKSAGRIKNHTIANSYPCYLTIDLYVQDRLVHTQIREHPFYKRVEYLNDNGDFTSKEVESDFQKFFIRLPLIADSLTIIISETLKNSPKKELILLKI